MCRDKMSESKPPKKWWREGEKVKYTDEEGNVHEATDEVWTAEDGRMWHLCRFTHLRTSGEVNVWQPRKENPVSCPRCRYRFDSPYRKRI